MRTRVSGRGSHRGGSGSGIISSSTVQKVIICAALLWISYNFYRHWKSFHASTALSHTPTNFVQNEGPDTSVLNSDVFAKALGVRKAYANQPGTVSAPQSKVSAPEIPPLPQPPAPAAPAPPTAPTLTPSPPPVASRPSTPPPAPAAPKSTVKKTSLTLPETWSECATEHFGEGLLKRWRGKKEEYCGGGSSLFCHEILQIKHAGPDNFCEALDVSFKQGNVNVDCPRKNQAKFAGNRVADRFLPVKYIQWAANLRFTATEPSTFKPDDAEVTLFFVRDCAPPYNPYHCMGDIVNAFEMRMMYGLDRDKTRIIFLDHHPGSNFYPLWQSLAKYIYTYDDWKAWTEPLPVSRALLAPFSGSNIIWKDFWHPTFCPHPAPILLRFRKHVLSYIYKHVKIDFSKYRFKAGTKEVVKHRVVIVDRPRQGSRRMSNAHELRDKVQATFPGSDVVLIDLGTIPFNDQLSLLAQTDLFIGMHGAAMQMMLFLKPTAKVMEFHPYNNRAHTYGNEAVWMQIPYMAWESFTPSPDKAVTQVNADEIVQKLKVLDAADPTTFYNK